MSYEHKYNEVAEIKEVLEFLTAVMRGQVVLNLTQQMKAAEILYRCLNGEPTGGACEPVVLSGFDFIQD